jgi:hypothetical protein
MPQKNGSVLSAARLSRPTSVGGQRFSAAGNARTRLGVGHPNQQVQIKVLSFLPSLAELREDGQQSPGVRARGSFQKLTPMDQAEINNWQTIAESMEAKGDTESWFYLRARAIADGKPDPMPSVSELMGDSAA